MLVKCKYCNIRVPERSMPLHLKRCINYRRLLKAGKIETGKTVLTAQPLPKDVVLPDNIETIGTEKSVSKKAAKKKIKA